MKFYGLRLAYRLSAKVNRTLYRKLLNVDGTWVISESRSIHLHPYIQEALALAAKDIGIPSLGQEDLTPGRLESLFSKYRSDKETIHSYEPVYSEILSQTSEPRILEIGLGSVNNNSNPFLPNRYRFAGSPGGSINAWREAFPNAIIVGADIDEEAVASIEGIGFGFVVDQNRDQSLDKFVQRAKEYGPYNLIVDDGLHEPNANLRTLKHLFPLLANDGSYVIEDVHESLIDFWKVISPTLDASLEVRDLRSQRPGCEDNVLIIFSKRSKVEN